MSDTTDVRAKNSALTRSANAAAKQVAEYLREIDGAHDAGAALAILRYEVRHMVRRGELAPDASHYVFEYARGALACEMLFTDGAQ